MLELSMSNGVPVGTIIAFALTEKNIPSGWLLCDGRDVSAKEYPDLYRFMKKIPDLRGRTLIGAGANYNLTDTGGEAKHTLQLNEMPSHNHGIAIADGGSPKKNWNQVCATDRGGPTGFTTDSGGNDHHNNMQPYYVVNYIIYAGE